MKGGLWSEKIDHDERLEYMLLPRLLALAERAWAPEAQWEKRGVNNWQSSYQNDWLEFAFQVNRKELLRLDQLHNGFDYRIPDPGVQIVGNKLICNTVSPNFSIHYTLDGSEPTLNSKSYTEALPAKGTVKLKVFNKQGRSGKTITINN